MLNDIFRAEKAMKYDEENEHYAELYERWFQTKRYQVKNLLEIGVYKGGALRSWLRYFPIADVYGIDIKDKYNLSKKFNTERSHFAIGNQIDNEFMLNVYPDIMFDVIIDDASHIVEHQWKTFNFMFQRVALGGTYIIEDIHTSYWPAFNGGYGRKNTFVEKAKTLVDMVNYKAYKIIDRAGQYKVKEEPTWLEKNIHSVSFYRGLCFIERKKAKL